MIKPEINKLINVLIEKLNIEQIYHWVYKRNGKHLQMLHIHLLPHSGMRYGEAKDICETIFEKQKDVHFTLYYKRETQRLIEHGLSRFILICRPENNVYQLDDTTDDVTLPPLQSAQIAKKCIHYIDTEKKKVASFLEGYMFYFTNTNYAHASFMLHQALELMLRTSLMLLVGNEKKSHCVVNKIAYLKTFDSVLGKLSIKDRDLGALQLLDDSYSAFRYNQGFDIDKKSLELVYDLILSAKEWIDQYQTELLQEIERELDPVYIAQKREEGLRKIYLKDLESSTDLDHRNLIAKALEIFCTPQSLRCFAYRSVQKQHSNLLLVMDEHLIIHHYYLVVGIADEAANTLDIQQKVNQLLPDHIQATLIVENESILYRQAKKGKPFYYNILQNAETWFEKHPIKDEWKQSAATPHSSAAYRRKQWDSRVQNARMFTGVYQDLTCIGDERAVCFALAISTEQVCLGLIKSLLGYSPSSLNLRYLMELVDVVAPEASAVFYREHTEEKQLFELLLESQREFRYSPNYFTGETEVRVLHERVHNFIQEADIFVKHYVEGLASEKLLTQTD